jgi:signal transduction histidine kinase
MNAVEKINILMIDDQPAKLLTYEVMLAELGENLIKVHSATEALDSLLHHDIAIVLMDVSMPDIDGFELAGMIRQHPRFRRTPIIFISAVHLTDLDRLEAYQRGAVDYISVPVSPELLRAKVSVFAELHRNARQMEALNRELSRLSARLMTAQDEERRRFARNLHDDVGQNLAAAKIMLDSLLRSPRVAESEQTVAAASEIVDQTLQQLRSLSYLMHPPLLDERGLYSALRLFLEATTERTGIKMVLDVEPHFPRLAAEVERAVFRIVQEALTNVYRHAEAQRATVSLVQRDGGVLLTVKDDGKGIPVRTAELRPGGIGVGLSGMRERARELGGELRLLNGNPGTVVEILLPAGANFLASETCATA